MNKVSIVITLVLLIMSPLATVHAGQKQAGKISADPVVDMQDPSKEPACDCCQKCKAAKGTLSSKEDVETQEDEEAPEKDGCGDCCARCGKPLTPIQQDAPPEKIEKHVPPDIIEKGKDH